MLGRSWVGSGSACRSEEAPADKANARSHAATGVTARTRSISVFRIITQFFHCSLFASRFPCASFVEHPSASWRTQVITQPRRSNSTSWRGLLRGHVCKGWACTPCWRRVTTHPAVCTLDPIETRCGRLAEDVELPSPIFCGCPYQMQSYSVPSEVYKGKALNLAPHGDVRPYGLHCHTHKDQGNTRVVASGHKTARDVTQARGTRGPLHLRTIADSRRDLMDGTAFTSVARVTLTCRDLRVSTIQLCQYRPGPPSSPTAAWSQLLVNRE